MRDEYPYSQREHDEAVGTGCVLLLVVSAPLLVAALSWLLGMVIR